MRLFDKRKTEVPHAQLKTISMRKLMLHLLSLGRGYRTEKEKRASDKRFVLNIMYTMLPFTYPIVQCVKQDIVCLEPHRMHGFCSVHTINN